MYEEYVQSFEGLISTSPSTSDEQIAPSESVSHSEVEADGDETIPAIEWEEAGNDDSRLEEAQKSWVNVDNKDRRCILLQVNEIA